ncbi:MAG: hypothetical protein H6579_09310 [Chitinophagales bacterium]|nr:hypothetical protein [Bacteroidota bacterium]MCB9257316.1 hypothetical protein [Chitinophagales bacterium]
MLRKVLIFLSCNFLVACDPIHRAEIINDSKAELLLEISFNEKHLHEGYYAAFQNNFPGFEQVTALSIDTVNHVNLYRLLPEEIFPLHDAIAKDPDFSIFDQIRILKEDTLVFSSAEELEAAFSHPQERLWTLRIH